MAIERKALLGELWKFQHSNRMITDSDLEILCDRFEISKIELKGVISFYHFFHRSHSGKYTIYLNDSILSEHAGREKIKNAFEKECGIEFGNLDPEKVFGLYESPCIGLSDQEPAALINFFPFVNLTEEKVKYIVEGLKSGKTPEQLSENFKSCIIRKLPKNKSVFFDKFKKGEAFSRCLSLDPDSIINEVEASGLCGRGGANFPTALKWKLAKSFPGKKVIICNADEGEPGTFKDRVLLVEKPELLVEGMAIAALATDADTGIIYLRAEYQYLKNHLLKTIDYYYSNNLLPNEFTISIELGAGAYVCGEETALIESLEGRRGEPRIKPPFPIERGYLGRPTIVNNVETFASIPQIMKKGASWYCNLGTDKSKGAKLLSVAGDCLNPGVYEIEWGMTLGELLKISRAEDPYSVQLGGAAGKLVKVEKSIDRKICNEDLPCGGSVMIFNKSRNLLKVAENFLKFFSNESCGICAPCRAGNPILRDAITKIQNQKQHVDILKNLKSWSELIRKTSRCGLGVTSSNVVLDILSEFPEVLEVRIDKKLEEGFFPFDLEKSLSQYNEYFGE